MKMQTSVIFPFEKDIPDIRDTAGIHPFSTFNSATNRGRELWAVVAMGRNGEIGAAGDMPWHLPEDLRHFKELTMGHPVIMGRRTWESIPRRPLPGRRNIVVTRNPLFSAEGAETANSLELALQLAPPPEVPVIIGGASIYKAALPYLTHIFMTRIDSEYPGADTWFPELNSADWEETDRSELMHSDRSGLDYHFVTLRKIKK